MYSGLLILLENILRITFIGVLQKYYSLHARAMRIVLLKRRAVSYVTSIKQTKLGHFCILEHLVCDLHSILQ